jgi:hypothetical protein
MIGETWNSGVAGNRKWQAAGFFFFEFCWPGMYGSHIS